MKLRPIAAAALTAASLLLGSGAHALTLMDQHTVFVGTVTGSPVAPALVSKEGIKGIGVRDELSIGESLTFDWTGGYVISNLQVGVLYNGPEFGDVRETAKISFYSASDTLLGFYTLTAGDPHVSQDQAAWSGPSGTVTNLSPMVSPNGAGLWRVDNPFGTTVVGKLKFEALSGACGKGKCNNQSDYLVTHIAAVPEPETYALMLGGLAAIGFVAFRRRRD